VTGEVVQLKKLKPGERRRLTGPEIGTQFDAYTRLFASYSGGDVFETGEWRARDIDLMLRRDGDAASVEQVLTLPARSLEYSIIPDKKDSGELDLVETQLLTPPENGGLEEDFDTVIAQMTYASVYRKAFFEKTWGITDDDTVKLLNLAWRPPSTCEVKRDEHTGRMDGFRQRAWWFATLKSKPNNDGYLDIPKTRAFVYVHGKHRNPLTGTSDMDICYWAYQQKQKILFLWLQFLECQSLPKVAAYGNTITEAEDTAEAIASMKSSSVGGFERPPGGAKLFDIIESSGKGADQFLAALNFLTTYQHNSVLAGFLSLPSAAALGHGSYALSESQSQFFLQSREAGVKEMCRAFTRDVIAPICAYNMKTAVPKLQASPLTTESSQQLITVLTSLAVAPNLSIPAAYVDLVATKAAQVLNLPASAAGAQPAQQGAARIAGATQAASKLVKQVRNGQPPSTSTVRGTRTNANGNKPANA
jgi:hypothetical protein